MNDNCGQAVIVSLTGITPFRRKQVMVAHVPEIPRQYGQRKERMEGVKIERAIREARQGKDGPWISHICSLGGQHDWGRLTEVVFTGNCGRICPCTI
jgi:hypothetical protein